MSKEDILKALAIDKHLPHPDVIDTIRSRPIDELISDLIKSENAFIASPITKDGAAQIIMTGNTEAYLVKGIFEGNQKIIDGFLPHGDWQNVMPATPEHTPQAMEYARAEASNHLIGRWQATSDRKHLRYLDHEKNFDKTKKKLAKLKASGSWQKILSEITTDSHWYKKHEITINSLATNIAKNKKEDTPSPETLNLAIARVREMTWFKNSLNSRNTRSAKERAARYTDEPESVSRDVASHTRVMGQNTGDFLLASTGRPKDRAFFVNMLFDIQYKNPDPNLPNQHYEAPYIIQNPDTPLTREARGQEFTGYVALTHFTNRDGQTFVSVAPLKQVGTQVIEGASLLGSTGQKSTANWRRAELDIATGEHNTSNAPVLDILVNTALSNNETKLAGIKVMQLTTDPGRLVDNTAVMVVNLNELFNEENAPLSPEKQKELVSGNWYNLDEVKDLIESRKPGTDLLPITNAFLELGLKQVELTRAENTIKAQARQLIKLIDALVNTVSDDQVGLIANAISSSRNT